MAAHDLCHHIHRFSVIFRYLSYIHASASKAIR